MSVRKINESTLTDIADAIRSKTGGSALINPEDMASEIESIESGTSITDGIVVKARDAQGYATEVDFYNSNNIVPINQFYGGSSSPWYKLAKINLFNDMVVNAQSFRGLTNLQTQEANAIFEKITEINGNMPFYGCSSITSAVLPKCTSIIGNACFRGCNALQSLRLPVCTLAQTGSNEDGIVAYLTNLTELVVGSIGNAYSPRNNGHFLFGNSNTNLVATFFVGNESILNTVLNNERRGSVQAATIVFKAANELEYNGTSYSAGDTILTSEVTS